LATIVALVVITVVSALLERAAGAPHASGRIGSLLVVACYASAFLVFLSGLSVITRARAPSGAMPRLMLLFATFAAFILPWLALAISGVFGGDVDSRLPIAAPSPGFAAVMASELNRFLGSPRQDVMTAGSACMLLWAMVGLVLFTIGTKRVKEQNEARHRAREDLLAHIRAEEGGSGAPRSTAEEPQA
jgi:hypothetical protein